MASAAQAGHDQIGSIQRLIDHPLSPSFELGWLDEDPQALTMVMTQSLTPPLDGESDQQLLERMAKGCPVTDLWHDGGRDRIVGPTGGLRRQGYVVLVGCWSDHLVPKAAQDSAGLGSSSRQHADPPGEMGNRAPLVGCADVIDQTVPSHLRLRGT